MGRQGVLGPQGEWGICGSLELDMGAGAAPAVGCFVGSFVGADEASCSSPNHGQDPRIFDYRQKIYNTLRKEYVLQPTL